jgi:predicted DNA-binding protein (MmcQ/YjbR family)
MTSDPLEQVRAICLALPESAERGGQHSAFQVRDKTFVYYTNDHHGDGRLAVTFKAPPGAQEILIGSDPDRFFRPAYIGHRGWVGLYVDRGAVDWDELGDLITDSYRLTAPKRLAALAQQGRRAPAGT